MSRRIGTTLSLLLPVALAAQQSSPTVDYHKADLIRASSAFISGDWARYGGFDFLDDSIQFWYKSAAKGDRNVVYVVDPRAASRRVLFDNARLAAALSVSADTILDPARFPSFKVVEDAKAIELPSFRKKPWRCDLATYKCAPLDSADYVLKERLKDGPEWANRSRDKKWDVFVYNYNLYLRPAALSDSEARTTRDSIHQAQKDTTKKDTTSKAPAKAKSDTTAIPTGAIQLTTDGVRLAPYGGQPNDVKQEPIKASRPYGLAWSPDNRKFAVSRFDFRGVRVFPMYSSTKDQPEDHSYYWAVSSDSINSTFVDHVIDIVDRTNVAVKEPASPAINFSSTPQWSRNSDRLFLLTSSRGYKRMRLSSVDVRTGDAHAITSDSFATWVEDLNFQTVSGGDDIFVHSERDGWGHIYRFGADGTAKGQVESGAYTAQFARSASYGLQVDSVGKRLYLMAQGKDAGVPYYTQLYRVNFDGTGMTRLTPEEADHSVSFIPKAPYFIDTYSRPDLPPVTVLRSAENGKVILELARGDVEYLRSIGWTPPELVQTKARDGVTDLWGLLYKPSNFDPKKSYPLLDHIYPGPQVGSVGSWGFEGTGEARALAELGFIVLELDHQGTPRRSKSFHDFYFGKMGDNGIPDHISGIRQLAARYSWIDINRVGIYGHSGGGFASTDAIFRYPDFYKVAVSGSGNHHPNTYGAFWGDKYQGLYNKAAFDEAANYTHASGLKGHLLLMTGDMDSNVHPSATFKVVDALIKANKNFDMVVFPDAGHGLPLYHIRRRWDYFVTYLLGATPPRDYEMIDVLTY